MGIDIQRDILGLKGQRVNQIKLDEQEQQLVIHCRRDKRRNAIDPVTGQKGTINRTVRRQVRDVPLFGYPLRARDRAGTGVYQQECAATGAL